MSVMGGIAAGLQIAGGAASIFGGLQAADERKKAFRKQAQYMYSQRMEELRRLQREDAEIRGTAVATAYASNVQVGSGSPARYLQDLQAEQKRQQAYLKWAAREEKELIRETGQTPGLGIETVGKAASTLASSYMTWKNLTG